MSIPLPMSREKLIDELKYKIIYHRDWSIDKKANNIADFIIQDRKRVVEPLVNAYLNSDFPKMTLNGQLNRLHTGTVETLNNAGVSNE